MSRFAGIALAVLSLFAAVDGGDRRDLSEPHHHHHRAVPGRRADRHDRARSRQCAGDEIQAKRHRRERHRRRHHHRHHQGRARQSRRLHAAGAQHPDFRERHAVQESAVRHRERPHAGDADQQEPADLGRPQVAARRQPRRTAGADEKADPAQRASRGWNRRPFDHVAVHAGRPRLGRSYSLSRRGACDDGCAGRARRSADGDAAVDRAAGRRRNN